MFIFPCSVQAVSMRAELRALFIACLTQGCTSPPAAAAPGRDTGPRPGPARESLGAKGGRRRGDGRRGPSEMGFGRKSRREESAEEGGGYSQSGGGLGVEASRGQPRPSPGEPGRWRQGAPLGKRPWGMQKHPSSPSAEGDFKRKGGKEKKKKRQDWSLSLGEGATGLTGARLGTEGLWAGAGGCRRDKARCTPQPFLAPALFWGDGL